MIDVQSQPDDRNIAIDKVGVKNIRYPITVLDRANGTQQTVASINMYVDLPHQYKGTHMSRFIEVLSEHSNNINIRNPHAGNSNYHAVLLTVEKRFAAGFVLLGSYTNAKLINDSIRTIFDFGDTVEQVNEVGYQNGKFDRRAERSIDPTDVAQRAVVSAVYELPFGTGKAWRVSNRVFDAITSGWQVNTISTIQGGLPVIVRGASNFRANRPNSTGQSAKLSERTAARWFDTSAFVNPPNFTYGNVGRVLPDVRTPGTVNFDLSLVKNTRIHERARLEFRAEAFNVANHVNLSAPNASFSPGPDGRNQSATFGTIVSSRDARIIQFGLKFTF